MKYVNVTMSEREFIRRKVISYQTNLVARISTMPENKESLKKLEKIMDIILK